MSSVLNRFLAIVAIFLGVTVAGYFTFPTQANYVMIALTEAYFNLPTQFKYVMMALNETYIEINNFVNLTSNGDPLRNALYDELIPPIKTNFTFSDSKVILMATYALLLNTAGNIVQLVLLTIQDANHIHETILATGDLRIQIMFQLFMIVFPFQLVHAIWLTLVGLYHSSRRTKFLLAVLMLFYYWKFQF